MFPFYDSESCQVVFPSYSAEALAERIIDCKPKVAIICNGVKRGVKVILLKDIVDRSLIGSGKNGVDVGMHWKLTSLG
jgi:acetyl-CoA synthetase